MNRQKKISEIIKRRLKLHRAKRAPVDPNKERYISKADRALMEAEQAAALLLLDQEEAEATATKVEPKSE